MNTQEALMTLAIFVLVLLVISVWILIRAVKQQGIESKINALKMGVIVDNMIDILDQRYGKEDERKRKGD